MAKHIAYWIYNNMPQKPSSRLEVYCKVSMIVLNESIHFVCAKLGE